MGHDDRGKRVVTRFQGLPARRIVAQFDHWKFDPDATAPQALFIAPRSPGRAGVTQHRQTHYRTIVAVEEPVVVDVHALGKIRLSSALNLRVDQYDLLDTVAPPDLHELVCQAGTQGSVADNLLQLGIE